MRRILDFGFWILDWRARRRQPDESKIQNPKSKIRSLLPPSSLILHLALAFVSILLVFALLSGADWVVGRCISTRLWPGPVGMLFNPLWEDHFDMADYQCCEKINSLGFRDREVSLEKTGTFRIVAIGDSFTYGWGVNLEDAWCKQLEANLRGGGLEVEVLNLGKPAAGPYTYAHIAETVIPFLHPDLVIVCMLNGDDLQQVHDDPSSGIAQSHFPNLVRLVAYMGKFSLFGKTPLPVVRDAAAMRAINIDNAKELLGKMKPEQRARYEQLDEEVKKIFIEGRLNPWLIEHSTGSPDYFMNTVSLDALKENIRIMGSQLKRVRQVAARWGASAIGLSIPEGFYVNNAAFKNVQRIGFHVVPEMRATHVVDQAIEKACEIGGMDFFGVLDEFRKHADDSSLYFTFDRHMTPAGNKLFADLITPFVAQKIKAAKKSG